LRAQCVACQGPPSCWCLEFWWDRCFSLKFWWMKRPRWLIPCHASCVPRARSLLLLFRSHRHAQGTFYYHDGGVYDGYWNRGNWEGHVRRSARQNGRKIRITFGGVHRRLTFLFVYFYVANAPPPAGCSTNAASILSIVPSYPSLLPHGVGTALRCIPRAFSGRRSGLGRSALATRGSSGTTYSTERWQTWTTPPLKPVSC